MEQETTLKEILNALKLHGEHMDEKMDDMEKRFDKKFDDMDKKFDTKIDDLEEKFDNKFEDMNKKFDTKIDGLNTKMDEGFKQVNQRFDRSGKKADGIRVDLTETRETTDFILSKTAQHEKKLHELTNQY